MQSSKTGPQYSRLLIPSEYAFAKLESWLSWWAPLALCDADKLLLNTYCSDSEGELAHGVESRRAAVEELFHEFRNGSASSPILRERSDLVLRGDLASDKKPE